MALTRKLLKGMGLTDEQVDTIIEAHTDTVDGLKADVSRYKADAEKLPSVQKQLDDLKAAGDGGYKEKYEKEHSDFESFKDKQQKKDTRSAKESALADVYRAAGIAEKYIPALLRIADYDTVELDKNGKAKDRDRLIDEAKQENADFIPTAQVNGAKPATPPNSGTKPTMTKDQIMQIKDTAERQKAIA